MSIAQTIVVHTSGSDPATVILAALGVCLALASLAWQARTFAISGSRISVEIKTALRGRGGDLTLPHTATAHDVEYMQSQGFEEPLFAVQVNNVGRGSTSIAEVKLVLDDGMAVNTVLNPPLPFRLVGESEQTWYFDANLVVAVVRTSEKVMPTGKPRTVRGQVKLGSKKPVMSDNHCPIPI